MPSVKVKQLRKLLDQFSVLYRSANATEQADSLAALSSSFKAADKYTVDELIHMLSTPIQQADLSHNVPSKH